MNRLVETIPPSAIRMLNDRKSEPMPSTWEWVSRSSIPTWRP